MRTPFLSTALAALLTASVAHADKTPAERADEYARLTPVADRYTLAGEELPGITLPDSARELLGDYKLQTTFYDSAYRPVTKAVSAGRHGAVVEITPGAESKLPPSRRFLTLYRLPDRANLEAQSPALVARLRAMRWNFKDPPAGGGANGAAELAALHETHADADPSGFYQQPVEKNRLWWIGLKRRLYGFDQKFPQPFRSPVPIAGKPAPTLRPGTPAEAGMRPDTAQRLDELLTQWVGDSDTGFDVCVARRGTIVLHKAYGQRQGKPITGETLTPLTSTSKMITATLLMQLVDQGWLDLDRPITELPGPLHGLKTQKPVTLRALYTHTAFSVNIDPTPDMEERVALVLPHLPIGKGYQYTGTSLELAWALASLETGESISTYARDHLLAPLGCRHTEVFNTGGATQSTALDVARICQMLLNRGAYGDQRFFREETFAEMTPRRLTQTLGPFTNDKVWGFGTHPWKVEGLSHYTFGHAGYYKSTAFVDPVHELVVVMVRLGAGKNYEKYHPQFLQTIVAGLVDRVPEFPEALSMSQVDVPAGRDRIELETFVENPGEAAAVLEYRYETAGTSWRIEPAEARIALPPKSRTPVRIVAQFARDNPAPLPMLRGAVHLANGPVPAGPRVEYWLRPLLRRSIAVGRLGQAPTSDGVIAKQEYGERAAEQPLGETHGRKVPLRGARFVAGYDERALYIAVTADEPAPRDIVRQAKERDDPSIKKEDYIELVIDAVGDSKTRKHFAVNLDGLQLDALAGDAKWNAEWTAKVGLADGHYVVEFAIPYGALGVPPPKPGDTWGVNVQRGRAPRDPKWELFSQWVPNYADFANGTHFGSFAFE